MRYTRIGLVILAAIAFSCSKEHEDVIPEQIIQDPLSKAEIDQTIMNSLLETDAFHWSDASDALIWSALTYSDYILTVGYKPSDETTINDRISSIDINQEAWITISNEIISNTLKIERNAVEELSEEDLVLNRHQVLPFLDLKVTSLETVQYLRSLETVRYVEPLGYEVDLTSDNDRTTSDIFGCSNDPNYNIPTSDYTTISPNAKASWHLYANNVVDAWDVSTGAGIGIGVIDTGLSPDQDNLNSNFNSGLSSGRYMETEGFYVSSWWWWADPDGPNDECGHGTAMAGVAAAPRSDDGSSVGVAYNANLVTVRGTSDVVLSSGNENEGVADALVYLGDRSDIHVISMSIGSVFSNSKISDGVRYAHGRGKLIFAAAGTSTSITNWVGVIFPASMDETVAVTGILENNYTRCVDCHSGSQVDFTIEMERSSGNNPLTLAMSGSQPATVGGSSVATATAAGIAALVWATDPSQDRDDVLTKMRNTADLYPNRDSQFGWGTLDGAAAVNY